MRGVRTDKYYLMPRCHRYFDLVNTSGYTGLHELYVHVTALWRFAMKCHINTHLDNADTSLQLDFKKNI